jgi:hypothetical protein
MNTGRELDALVAEKVMGWRDVSDGYGTPPEATLWEAIHIIPHYSTDIAAAWQVVERMRDQGWTSHYTDLSLDSREPWHSWHFTGTTPPNGPTLSAQASTVPHAICLAALRAVGVEV